VGDVAQLRVPVLRVAALETADRGCGQLLAVSLAYVEHMGHPERVGPPGHPSLVPGLAVDDPQPRDDRSQDGDAVLALAHVATQPEPGVEPGDAGGVGPLGGDEEGVPPAVAVEAPLHVQPGAPGGGVGEVRNAVGEGGEQLGCGGAFHGTVLLWV